MLGLAILVPAPQAIVWNLVSVSVTSANSTILCSPSSLEWGQSYGVTAAVPPL